MPRRAIPALLFAAAILAMSGPWGSFAQTSNVVDPFFSRLGLSPENALLLHAALRKLGHLVAYATLGVLAHRATLDASRPSPTLRSAGMACGFAVLVASLDESLQALTPARTACIADVAIDVAGAAFGVFVATRLFSRRAPAAVAASETDLRE